MYQSQNAHWFTYLCQLQKVFSMENALLPWVLHVSNDANNYQIIECHACAFNGLDEAFEKLV